jgi:hypothetical protein
MYSIEELSDRVHKLEERLQILETQTRFKTVLFGMVAGILAILAAFAVHYLR